MKKLSEIKPNFCIDSKIIHHMEENKFQIIDKNTSENFLVGSMELVLLTACNGEKNINQITKENKFGLSENDICRFVVQAQSIGILNDSKSKQKPKINVLRLQLPLFRLSTSFLSNKRIATALKYILYFLFTLSLIYILSLIRQHANDIFAIITTSNYLAWENLAYYLGSFLLIALFHELSHGIVLSSFGVVPGRMGVMLNYFHPSCYIEITGVNKIPSKFSRIQVWLAGVISQVCLFALSIYIMLNIQIGIQLKQFLVIETIVNFALIFFNLFYVIKLDGYNILCDLFDEPMLREKALSQLRTKPKQNSSESNELLLLVVGIVSVAYLPIFVFSLITNIVNLIFPDYTSRLDIIVIAMIIIGAIAWLIRYGTNKRRAK